MSINALTAHTCSALESSAGIRFMSLCHTRILKTLLAIVAVGVAAGIGYHKYLRPWQLQS